MTSARRIVLVIIALVLLAAGVVLGFTPARATLTEVAPELRQITVSCGNNLLRHTPAVLPGDLVALPDDPSVLVPRAGYQANCDVAVGWRRWTAWALTGLGVLILAVTLAAARTPRLPGERRARRFARTAARRAGSGRHAASPGSAETGGPVPDGAEPGPGSGAHRAGSDRAGSDRVGAPGSGAHRAEPDDPGPGTPESGPGRRAGSAR